MMRFKHDDPAASFSDFHSAQVAQNHYHTINATKGNPRTAPKSCNKQSNIPTIVLHNGKAALDVTL